MKEREPVFLPASEAAARVARDLATIRRWAQNGQVRRRSRGRIVEYREDDLLAVAGLAVLDEKDRTIAQLRLDVAHEQEQRAAALAKVAYQREKFDSFQERLKRERGDHRQQIATLQAQLVQAADVVAQWQRAGQEVQVSWEAKYAALERRNVELAASVQVARAPAIDYSGLFHNALLVAKDCVVLAQALITPLTRSAQRDTLKRLSQELERLEKRGKV